MSRVLGGKDTFTLYVRRILNISNDRDDEGGEVREGKKQL